MNDLSLSRPPRYAIVTGAAAGIGRATVDLLVAAGWKVGAFDMDEPGLKALQAALPGPQILAYRLDVTDDAAWVAAARAFSDWSGGQLDVLVNNAGIIALGQFAHIPLARTRRMLDVNIMGVVNGIHACLELLKATPRARVVNVSSIAALTGWPYTSVYSASKSAVYNLTEALSAELAPSGITVCDVLPSFVGTQLVGEDHELAAVRSIFRTFSIAFTNPSRVARHIVAAIDSRNVHHIVGRQAHVYAFVTRYLPWLGRSISRAFGRRFLKAEAARKAGSSERAER
jgi:NAD(P)-dependent dehydrogenase (short-subunit alcohol dehydrogenase family)